VVLNELKDLGVTLALDDFGTGYSSLNYLKQFPIDIVKIDRGFTADIEQDPASHSIILTTVHLAQLLGMTVVAEGVETAGQHERLIALGCDSCQGNFFAPPMSASDLHDMCQGHVGSGIVKLPRLASHGNA
jgi:EAL domain-containing protein (putative c-di-GMP-specific phosphodiesterase class I)